MRHDRRYGRREEWLIVDEGADLVADAYGLEQLAARVLTAPDSIPEREVDRLLAGWARSSLTSEQRNAAAFEDRVAAMRGPSPGPAATLT